MNPQDDPEFWERPADDPEYIRQLRGLPDQESCFPMYYSMLFETEHLIYRGDLAINKKTKTLYVYNPETGEWARDDQPRKDPTRR